MMEFGKILAKRSETPSMDALRKKEKSHLRRAWLYFTGVLEIGLEDVAEWEKSTTSFGGFATVWYMTMPKCTGAHLIMSCSWDMPVPTHA